MHLGTLGVGPLLELSALVAGRVPSASLAEAVVVVLAARCAWQLAILTGPKCSHCRYDPHHDVQRVVRLKLWPRIVPFFRSSALRLSSGTAPLSAVPE